MDHEGQGEAQEHQEAADAAHDGKDDELFVGTQHLPATPGQREAVCNAVEHGLQSPNKIYVGIEELGAQRSRIVAEA
jgi:hypothetical protein